MQHDAELASVSPSQPLNRLRAAAYAAAGLEPKGHQGTTRTAYERSCEVRAYVLARASGIWESGAVLAPLMCADGTPCLEPYHTRRVSDGGPDHPRSVGAICPTCHRHIHHDRDGRALNAKLEERLEKIEANAS